MANHKSAIKRIRSNNAKKTLNKYQEKSARTAIKKFSAISDKKKALEQFPIITAMLDKLAKKNIIHKNKASNLKAKLAKKINAL
jgi:small subunit ribosomal protein S20